VTPVGGRLETDAARSWRAGRGSRVEDYSDELAKRGVLKFKFEWVV